MKGQPELFSEIIVDNFAGGGGASTGIELATGRIVDVAINHDTDAILMHRTNHPYTEHYQESVWDIDPIKVCRGRPVGLAWFSPDCKHFSKAKGGKPVEKSIRGLAWIVLRWAGKVRPKVIILENVEEFVTWGPVRKGRPVKQKAGQTFQRWVSQLEALGYTVEWKELKACDYGAPTIRKRFFCVARCDGRPISWPVPTHGDPKSQPVKSGKLKPWRTAAEIIDWSIPCPSIFERKKPLAENTMKRITRGLKKFVLDNPSPFIVQVNHGGDGFRGQDIHDPLQTVTAATMKGTNCGQFPDEPLQTITAGGLHFGEVRAFLIKYYGQGIGKDVKQPLDTVVSKDKFGLVTVAGEQYQIADIGMRMLEPKELYAAQGFPPDYIIDRDFTGKAYPKSAQVARCGNAVCPPLAKALVAANLPEWCNKPAKTMKEIRKAVTA